MAEEVVTQEIEESAEEVMTGEESQENVVEEKASTEEVSPEPTIDDIVVGEKPEDKTPSWAKKRFDELTKKIYEKDRRIKELEETRKAEPSMSSHGERPVIPVENDFVDMEDYRKARIQYEDEIDNWKSNQRQNTEFQEKQKQDREANLVSFNENAKRMREKYPDFDVAVNEPVFTPVMIDEITDSDIVYGPEIGYFLSKNPSESLRLSKLTPRRISREIGKLEERFSRAVKRTSTNAPTPLTPIKGDDAPARDTSKMTGDEWYKWDMQQKLKKFNKEK